MYFASGTPHWTPADCKNITNDANAKAAGEQLAAASWRGVPLGGASPVNGTHAADVPSPAALRAAADQSDTLRSFAFLKVP